MTSSNEFPGNLSTNVYVLQDFSEIAYIVCTGVESAKAQKDGIIHDTNLTQDMLSRLKNAEQQFRQASILTILDAEKLELFTFYKKIDIVKDQKSILAKFGQVCKSNQCIIAYKIACRIVELLKPEKARVYKLFTAAVISNLRLNPSGSTKTVKINTGIWLLRTNQMTTYERSPVDQSYAQWSLEKVDLQIIPNGQLLLSIARARWPSLLSMTDLIDPDIWPIDYSRGATLYLVPTGQLARYGGRWVTAASFERSKTMFGAAMDREFSSWQFHWIERITEWLNARTESPVALGTETIWLEVEIPVNRSPDHSGMGVVDLIWKRVYWPALMCYIFAQPYDTITEGDSDHRDVLRTAQEWYTTGAREAQRPEAKPIDFLSQPLDDEEGRLFDDDAQFGTPQNFMSVPMQTFVQSQAIYPTPPDVFNTQPTPGMSLDGMAQTPATIARIENSNFSSSPLAVTTDASQVPTTTQVISNFLDHDPSDELFDDVDEEKMRHNSFDNEPNWDFFNTEIITEARKQSAGQMEVTLHETDQVTNDRALSVNAPGEQSPGASKDYPDRVDAPGISESKFELENDGTVSVSENDTSQGIALSDPTKTFSDTKETDNQPVSEQFGKRRRSSVYEIVAPQGTNRDMKYSKNGKYWFAPKEPTKPSIYKQSSRAPVIRPASSDSDCSRSSCSDSIQHSTEPSARNIHPWTEYIADSSTNEAHDASDDEDTNIDFDAEIDGLLSVISSASGVEPFTTDLLPRCRHSGDAIDNDIPESTSLQILAEQICHSTFLSKHPALALPQAYDIPSIEVAVDDTGSTITLTSLILGELSTLSPPAAPAKQSKIHGLSHGKIHLQQADIHIAADVSILDYWEILNLQPVSGPKEIEAICIHEKSESFSRGSRLFLERMSETWMSCNLGVLKRTVLEGITNDPGQVSWDNDDDLGALCQEIGKALAMAQSGNCTVIYMIVPNDNLRRCVHLCNCFTKLFESMVIEDRDPNAGDIVLQLIPSALIVQTETIAVPSEDQMIALALELYQRIPPSADQVSMGMFAPAVIISEPWTTVPHFELSTAGASPLARYGHCCHVAYSLTVDGRWMVAAWTDDLGKIATSVVYCLIDDDGTQVHPLTEVFEHLCETSAAMMNRKKDKWWLCVVKIGPYQPHELNDLSFTVSRLDKDHKLLSRTAILNTELTPRISLKNANVPNRALHNPSHLANTLNTPVTTPQAVSTTSPEQSMPITPTAPSNIALNAPTPPEQNFDLSNEAEMYLNNPSEDSWAVTLPFGLNQSYGSLDARPALVSGLLLKRNANRISSNSSVTSLGVNLIELSRPAIGTNTVNRIEAEQVLEEILEQYRCLHLLAVARRCVDPQDTCVPWHIASAFRMARFIEQFV